MKTILVLLSAVLFSCSTPEDTKRLASIVDLALSSAERRGVISAQDAADVREAETIVLKPEDKAKP